MIKKEMNRNNIKTKVRKLNNSLKRKRIKFLLGNYFSTVYIMCTSFLSYTSMPTCKTRYRFCIDLYIQPYSWLHGQSACPHWKSFPSLSFKESTRSTREWPSMISPISYSWRSHVNTTGSFELKKASSTHSKKRINQRVTTTSE